ncbi:MAG: hypothetical protein AB1555_10425 [Nitrospirota bacterium]
MSDPSLKLSDLTLVELKELVQGLVDDRLRELLGDPDLGLQLGEAVRARLKASLASTARISGDEIADKLGLKW